MLRRNGYLELKYNEDRSMVVATIMPPGHANGEPVTVTDVLNRLKHMGVSYGIREQVIREALHHVDHFREPITNLVVAQGTLPVDGADARVRYHLPLEVLTIPLPKRTDNSGLPDWFALDPAKFVKAGDLLATITPAQPGTPGKTLTWPIQLIPAKNGKPAELMAGANVRASDDATGMVAAHDGYVVLQNNQMTVYALRQVEENVAGSDHVFPMGAVFLKNIQHAHVQTGTFLAIRGVAVACHLRAHGDMILRHAENCSIIATGNVYVLSKLKNCQVNTRKKVIALERAEILGGQICATEGIEAVTLGSEEGLPTQILSSIDHYTPLRDEEIEKELALCQENIHRIGQTIKPFATLAAQTTLPEDKRLLFQKLQAQLRTQEARIKDLHNERRSLAILMKERVVGYVRATDTVYPGVQITLHSTVLDVTQPYQKVQFTEGGNAIQIEAWARAA
jgi:uncharacterized protein (DUF342 family)